MKYKWTFDLVDHICSIITGEGDRDEDLGRLIWPDNYFDFEMIKISTNVRLKVKNLHLTYLDLIKS